VGHGAVRAGEVAVEDDERRRLVTAGVIVVE
jgi:hypothetical protein